MAELGLAVAQTLLAAMNFLGVKEKCEFWGYKSKLADLGNTVKTVKTVLEDFQGKELNAQGRGYIEDLKDAVYDADDLFDELATRIELKELEGSKSKGSQICKTVSRFFSSDDNQLSRAYRMYNKVKEIEKKLNSIADDRNKFVLNVDNKPICMRREETCSYIDVKNIIIGRDVEKNDIIDKLLRSKNEGARFFTIVGMGGMGKTALAKLVFNDEKVKQEFGNSMYWVCVADQDRQQFDPKAILSQILEVATDQKASSLEVIQQNFRKIVEEKKYLLVLDDVWNEKREEWAHLEQLLPLGQEGSRILITTRSERTATIIGDGQNYMLLQGLSPENSRRLFEMTAFSQGHHQQTEFRELGNKIVGKCCNNPLAIKVVGSLLYGQDIHKWKSFEKSELANIDSSMGNTNNKIMSVLKFSYHNLEYPLKCCFTYCALFPKDYILDKRVLIRLWMAQGYIVRSEEGQSIEDAAEEHFSILLRRCFFQDVKKDDYDDVVSVKIHDLMHDVAQEVGGEEIQVLSSAASNVKNRTRHVSVFDEECIKSSSNWTNLRSIIRLSGDSKSVISLKETQVGNWSSVRVLDLKYADGGRSLNSIDRLHHLRYLNLSGCPCEELPSSITKLHNLETLLLRDCDKLTQLPHGFSKLVKLTELDVYGCWELNCMPLGMDKLTRLRVLPYFVVGEKNIAEKQCVDDELRVLGTLTNLTGRILIYVGENYRNAGVKEEMSGGYLSRIPGLKEVDIYIRREESSVEEEAVMEKLQPHPNLKGFYLEGYKGRTLPRWGRAEHNWATYQLVTIDICDCEKLIYLPSFSKLPHLKSLVLSMLESLEYVEKASSSSRTFFPSLVSLEIKTCEQLKGWFWEDADGNVLRRLRTTFRFPCLSTLEIIGCRNLTSFPPCPFVKDINFLGVNKTGQLMKQMMDKQEQQGQVTVGTCSASSSSSSTCLATLAIREDDEMESLSEFENVFEKCGSSLRELVISSCYRLSRFSRGLQHLTALESLELWYNRGLNFWEDDDNESMMMQWKPLHHSLRRLEFSGLTNMRSLPKGMQYLTSLTTLVVGVCEKLEGLPEWISCLSSLQSLSILNCPAVESVTERIQNLTSLKTLTIELHEGDRLNKKFNKKLDGEDWTKLQHVPNRRYHIIRF